MTTSFLGLIELLTWPVAILAGGWAIALKSLADKDQVSKVVETLTPPDAALGNASSEGARLLRIRSIPIVGSQNAVLSTVLRRRRVAFVTLRMINRLPTGVSPVNLGGRRRSAGATPRNAPSLAQHFSRLAVFALFAIATQFIHASPASADRYAFDQRRSEVRFAYKMAYSTQRGRFTKVSGTLEYNEKAPEKSKIHASISAASLTTGEALVDEQLKGPSFFNVEASPTIAFKSSKVRSISPTAAEVAGEITVNGITKPITLSVSLKDHDDPALKYDKGSREFVATTKIQRSQFNMTDYKSLVDDEVEIEIAAIVRPKQ